MQKLDRFLAWLATRQHGVATRAQLLAGGFSRSVIQRRIESGHLIGIHPGIYLVGHRAAPPLAMNAGAILACQPHAYLSHGSAARLWRLPVPADALIHVTVAGRSRRSLAAVVVHFVKEVASADTARLEGLPVTSLSLTLLDLGGSLTEEAFAAAVNEARVEHHIRDRALHAVLRRHPTRKGARALRSLLATERGPRITESEAERRALRVMRAHGIEPDATQHPIGPYRVDFWFEHERVAVEVDGYRYHSTPGRFVEDRRRAGYLAARDIVTFPLTWPDLGEPTTPMRRLRATLASRSARTTSET